MSGICGIVELGGQVPAPEHLAAMTTLLERRGPDRTHGWLGGGAALGHTLLATTPEALVEVLPLTDAASGCTITADVRLDNRKELVPALGPEGEERVIGDGELILRAWLRWGEDCVDHLLGDFAFAIWDPRTERLFCARDHMGMRQLTYWHDPGERFVFATEPRAVVAVEGVPRRLNEARVADFLEGSLEAVDLTSTFFGEVFRLPPAHCLTVDADGLRMRRFWRLEPGSELELASDEDYAQAFLDVFTQAVECRLRAPAGTVGSMLSGGMDSGSVVAVASRLMAENGRGPLPTFSGVGPDGGTCVETRAIHAAIAMPNLDPHLVNWADMPGYADELVALARSIDEPFDGEMTLPRAIYLYARQAGVRVMLDGVGGDLCFSNGSHVARLVRGLHWIEAWRETALENRFWGVSQSTLRCWLRHQRHAWTPAWVRWLRREVLRRRGKAEPLGLCRPDFAQRIGLAARQARDRDQYPSRLGCHRKALADILQRGFLTAGRERYDRTAAACAVEPRDPFLDLRVLQFCLSLPLRQLTRFGWPKFLLRCAMAGLVPDAVRWRRGKEHLGWTFTQRLVDAWAGWAALPAQDLLARYAVLPEIRDGSPTDCVDWSERTELRSLGDWFMRFARHEPEMIDDGQQCTSRLRSEILPRADTRRVRRNAGTCGHGNRKDDGSSGVDGVQYERQQGRVLSLSRMT